MVLSIICAALAGVLMSQGARVWLLFAVITGAMLAALAVGLSPETSVGGAIGRALMIGVTIQLGYALGLFARSFAVSAPRTRGGDIYLRKH